MADQSYFTDDDVISALDKSYKLRNELASKAGKPDAMQDKNLEIGLGDAGAAITGSLLSNVGTGIKEASIGDMTRAARKVADGSFVKGAVDAAVSGITDKSSEELSKKGLLTDALGLDGVGFVGVDPSKNPVKEAASTFLNKAADTGEYVADKLDSYAVKPVAGVVGGGVKAAGDGIKDWMSDDAKEAAKSSAYTQDENGDFHLGNMWSDPARASIKLLDSIGSMGGTVIAGLLTGGAVKGMVMRTMLKRGASEGIAKQTAEMAAQKWSERAVAGEAMSMSVGQTADQSRESYGQLSDDDKLNSQIFGDTVKSVYEQHPELSSSQRMAIVDEQMRDKMASFAKSDPSTYAAAAAGTMLGDSMLFKMVTGKAGASEVTGGLLSRTAQGFAKGGLGEGVGEAVEEGVQQNVQNRASNAIGGTNIDPMQGVALAAAEAGTMGALTGGAVGSISSVAHGSSKPVQPSESPEQQVGDTQTQSGEAQPTDLNSAEPVVEDAPDMETAINEVYGDDVQTKVPGSFSIGKDESGYRAAYVDDNGELQVSEPYATPDEAQKIVTGGQVIRQDVSQTIQPTNETQQSNEGAETTQQPEMEPQAAISGLDQALPENNQQLPVDGPQNINALQAELPAIPVQPEQAPTKSTDIFSQLTTVRVTKRGNPFASQKEALLASRKTETPIELPTGGFGVVDKAELEQVQSNISKQEATQYSRETAPAPDVNSIVNDISVGLPDGTKTTVGEQNTNQSSSSQAITPVIDVNDANASYINQPADSAIKNVLGVKTEKQSNNDGSSTYRFSFNDGHASVLTHSDGTAHIMDVQIGDGETAGLRGKGVGTKLYEHIGNELAKDGVILESTRWSKHRSAISPAALRVWEKLEKAGTATVVGNENARVLDRFSGVNEVRDIPIYEFTGNKSSTNQSTVNQHGVNESASNQVVAQNQPNVNVNEQSQTVTPEITESAAINDQLDAQQEIPVIAKPAMPWTGYKDKPDGTMVMEGDPVQLKEWAKQNNITAIKSKTGVVVGKNSVPAVKDIIAKSSAPTNAQQNEAAPTETLPGQPTEIIAPPQPAEAEGSIPAASVPWTNSIDKPDGTMILEGDPVVLKAWAKDNGITAIKSKNGVVVGKSSVPTVKDFISKQQETGNVTSNGQLSAEKGKISDFGEKIGGAKKDAWQTLKDSMNTEAIVEHTTGKGKVLRGVVRTGLTVAQAKAIDPYTFKKDGGYFIREQHLDKLSGVKAETSITAEPEAENDATFTPRDGWETNLQAAREYANHLRKAGKISEQDALKAWNSTESLAKLIKQIEVVQTPVVGHGDDAITLDQLKQLRVDIINKINQQEADNRYVDDRLMRKKSQLDKAIAEAEGTTEKQAAPKEQFADNKLFTADRVAAARARMKSKMGNLNSGLDPEMLVDGITIAGAYIESGVRDFTAYAKSMTDDFGDGIKPFLLSFWEGARNYPGLDTKGMTSVEDSAKQHAELASNKPAQTEKADTPPTEQPANRERQILRDGLHEKLGAGESINNNNDLKRVAAELLGVKTGDLSTMQLKEAQEAYEAAAVRHRRDAIVDVLSRGNGVHEAFQSAVEAYEGQPNLDVRTAKSSDLQAYSTPTPMALLANLAAGAWSGKTVFEPTAGNGLLLLTADAKTTYSNELDPDRADSLAWSGFNVTIKDATNNPLEGMVPEKVDSVLANPPFGKYRDEAGKPAKVEFSDPQGRTHVLGEIDHIIAKNALDAMKDDGKATLILGAPKEAGDYTGNNKAFLNWLYSNYNVVHHVEAGGDLFKGQGAGWPTQMIVIHGRAKDGTGKFAPFKGEIQRLNTWDSIYDSFKQQGLLDTQGAVFSKTTGHGQLSEGYQPVAELSGSERGNNQQTGSNGGRDGAGRSGRSGKSVGNGLRQQSGNSTSPDGAFDSQPDISGRKLESAESKPATNSGNSDGDRRADNLGLSGERNGNAVDKPKKKEISTVVKKANEYQAEYQTASNGLNKDVLTPVNMASYTQSALASIQDRHGSVDQFVANRLGYDSTTDMNKVLMGLQADAVALAVDAIERGRAIIIGDQTGVGKGRQAAGVIRYALQKGKIPIFITQKPNLFTDMYDDLADIGVDGVKPLIVNQDNGFISKGDKTLFNLSPKERTAALNHVIKTGKLPDGHNALFLTYSQISSDNSGKKFALLDTIAENAIMVMDESHTASGQDSKLGLAFQSLVNKVNGLVYLSATYAKRPDNMLLYTRTDLGQAVDNREALVSIIANGGLGMQTYIAGKLAEAGQMVRRERSFEGIEIKNHTIKDKTNKIKTGFDQATSALRAIQDLSEAWRGYVESVLAKQIQKESGMDTRIAGNQADTKVDVTLFSSVVHNYIAQLSLGLKAKETAKLAIEAINRNERPVIALENTMGAALKDYMQRTGKKVGDSASDLTYSTLLKSIADGALAYTVKTPGQKDNEKKVYMPISKISDPLIQSLYNQVMDAADAMTIDIPASPIDAIRYEIIKAGYTVAEITGRDMVLDYANNHEIANRPAREKNRRRVVDAFNSKKLDVLILNQAGSTGLSLHASERFADQSPRHMIVAQPSLDINTFLQMLGRVNRTGQVELPSYSLAWLDLPSEKRPAAVLSRKMSSLNANTSGNTDSATSIEAVDILNPYGDQVVEAFVEANRETLMQYSPRLVRLPMDDQATYFLGKLAVLPSDVAENVINQIEKEYNALIEYLNATGQNELNINEVDLDATPVKQRIVSEGRKGAGVFSEPTYVTKVDVKAQGKAPTWDEVNAALKDSSQADFDEAVSRMMTDNGFADRLKERLAKAEKNLEINRQAGKSTKAETEQVEAIKLQISSHEAGKNNLAHLFSSRGMYRHGGVLRIRLPDSEEAITGIVVGLTFDNDGGNPAAKSKWRMKIMVADRVRSLPISLSQAEGGVVEGQRIDNDYNLKAIFDRAASQPAREYRYIMTGNLIEAQNRSVEKGRIIPFTTSDGRVIQGMLMPKKFDPEAGSLREDIKVTSAQAFQWLSDTNDRTSASLGLRTREGDVVLRRLFNGGYEIEMPKAVSKGKRYWGDPSMVKLIGEHAVKGNGKLNVRLTNEQAKGVVSVMERINPLTITNQAQIADFNRMTGKSVPAFSEKGMKFSKVKMTAAEQAGKGMTKPEAELATKEWLKQFKTDINVRVVKDQAEFKKALADLGQPDALQEGEVANAAYLPDSKTILINASAIQNPKRLKQIMRHEILVHHGLRYVVGEDAYAKIMNAIAKGYETSQAIRDAVDTVTKNYADKDMFTQMEEAFGHYAETRPADSGPIGRLWQRIVSMVKSALQKVGFIGANESEQQLDSVLHAIARNMRQGIEDGVMAERSGDAMFSKKSPTDIASADGSQLGAAEKILKLSGNRLINFVKEQRGYGLGALSDRQIDQVYKGVTGGAVSRYQKLRAQMEADRNDILLDAETRIDPLWSALKKDSKAALSNLMHDATMSKLHPDIPLVDNTWYQEAKTRLYKARKPETKALYQQELDVIKENYKNLSERYKLTSKEGKDLYQVMKETYNKQWDDLRNAIEQRIDDVMGEGGKAISAELRLKMEQSLKHGPYFPLARFGDYVVRAKKGDQFIREHFENRRDAERAMQSYQSDGYKSTLTVKEEKTGGSATAHDLGMKVMELLDNAKNENSNPSQLKDSVWQAMLDVLPDASYAKHAIHRKRIKGASRDGHRAFLNSVYHYAFHVSKIRYGHKMKAELDQMNDNLQATLQGEPSAIKEDDLEVAQQVLNEMHKRHELNMNPKGSSLAGAMGNIGFLWYLGFSPASAVINLTQNAMVMLPQLAGKFGYVKSTKFMLKAMSDYARHGVFKKGTKEAWVSLTRATKGISSDEKAMLNELYRAGVLDLTQAHSVAARADTDQQNISKSSVFSQKAMQLSGAMFHNAEVLNREVAALTAYRLLKEQQPNLSNEAALDQVTEMVYDGHGDYAASNRPRYMRGDVAKVLTQFKIYSQMMTYTLTRNAILAAKGDMQALKTTGFMLGHTFIMAGMMGLPTPISLLLYGIAAAFDDDDDRTAEASFRLGLSEAFGPDVGELIAKGPINSITGLSIADRTGLGDLWWRSPKAGAEGDDLVFHYLQQVAGPALGIGISAARGFRSFADGDIQRGVEAISPKAIKDIAKAYRQSSEGERTRTGDSIIDDVPAWNIAMQSMGFSSAKMSQVYAARGYIKGKEKVIEDERSNLLADFFDAKRSGDEEAMRDVMERIKAFNSKHDRAETITGRTLMQSIKSRNRSMERTQAGVYLSKKREYLRSEGKFLEQ